MAEQKPQKIKLTAKRLEDAKRSKSGMVRGLPLRHSAAIESRYVAALTRMVNQMIQQTEREIRRIYASEGFAMDAKWDVVQNEAGEWVIYKDGVKVETYSTKATAEEEKAAAKKAEAALAAKTAKAAKKRVDDLKKRFESMFSSKADEVARSMLGAVTKESAVNLAGSLKQLSGQMTVKADFMTKPVGAAIRASLAENASLITSMPTEYMDRIAKQLEKGGDAAHMAQMLQDEAGIAKRRAKNIALDQTRKAYSSINEQRMKAVGITKFEWVHSGGGMRPRQSHIDHYPTGLNGGIFDLAKGAYDPDAEMWILPAQLPNCRCTMVPVIEPDEA